MEIIAAIEVMWDWFAGGLALIDNVGQGIDGYRLLVMLRLVIREGCDDSGLRSQTGGVSCVIRVSSVS